MKIVSANKIVAKMKNQKGEFEPYWSWIVVTDQGFIFESVRNITVKEVLNEATGQLTEAVTDKTTWRQVMLPPVPNPVR
jgi:hypothetical protein